MKDDDKARYLREAMDIVKSRSEFINRNFLTVRDPFQKEYSWPELDPLRHEISLCLIFGLHQAAITLTNHLFESLLKNALIIHDSKQRKDGGERQGVLGVQSLVDLFKPALRKFQSNDLGDNINRACTVGLVDKAQKKQLHEFRDQFRNAYTHSDKRKTFGNRTIEAQALRISEGRIESADPEEAKLEDFVIGHGLFQAMQAEQQAVPYFLYMDKLVRQVRERLFGPIEPTDSVK